MAKKNKDFGIEKSLKNLGIKSEVGRENIKKNNANDFSRMKKYGKKSR
jgi:hypothetical protein